MQNGDSLLRLLVEFFDLPPGVRAEEITQASVPAWDSLAMVQLITELQNCFSIDFDLEEIQALGSYQEIHDTLARKCVLAA